MSDATLVVIDTFFNHVEAELAQGALEAGGIASVISADDAGGMRPHLAVFRVRLLVRADDAERAADILRSDDILRPAD